jgi:hypothetical protein
MADGFEVVPEELERAADSIGDAVRDVADILWDRPSGDYGHPVLGSAFAHFLDDIKDHVDTIHEAALGHGMNLKDTASHYRDADIGSGEVLRNCWLSPDTFEAIQRNLDKSGIPGGGWAGGVGGVGQAPATEPPPTTSGFVDTHQFGIGKSEQELNAEGVYH